MKVCWIRGFLKCYYKGRCFLRCDAVFSGTFGGTSCLDLLLAYFLLIKCLAYSSVLKMEAVLSSETSVKIYWTIRHRILERSNLYGFIWACSFGMQSLIWAPGFDSNIRGLTIKFANSPPCACHGRSGQKPQYGLMALAYQRFTAVLLLIYVSLFLSGFCYCLSVFWCEWKRKQRDVSASLRG
jgi:hypothetical protein